MKKNIILFLIVAFGVTACNKDDKPLANNTKVVEETSFSIENDVDAETTYTNDHFNFSITLGNDFISKDVNPEDFKSKTNDATLSVKNTKYSFAIVVTLSDFYGTNESYTLDEYIKLFHSFDLKNTQMDNISEIKKSNLNGINFRYYTFDHLRNNSRIKTYLYMTNKDKKFYTISVLNVTDESKDLISEILKSISIK